MLFYCWASVADNGPTLKQHWLNVSCLLGHNIKIIKHDIFWGFSLQTRYIDPMLFECWSTVRDVGPTFKQTLCRRLLFAGFYFLKYLK